MKSVASVLSQFFARFLGAFAKLKKNATVTFVISVCLSARPPARPPARIEQFGSHGMDFHEIRFFSIFRKCLERIQFS